ncbi:MAG: hypothetical protein WCK91_01935 [bacterium]
MAKSDMLGPLTRALIGIKPRMLGLVLDIVKKLSNEGFYPALTKFVREWKPSVEEAVNKLITRAIVEEVNRTLTPQEALAATGRKQYVTDSVVASMSKGEGKGAEVVFLKPRPEAYVDGIISDDRLEEEYEFFGLKPVDPYSLCAVNEADKAFADNTPNATHWKDREGKWCYAAFYRWSDGGRFVFVRQFGRGWFGLWSFGGLRK